MAFKDPSKLTPTQRADLETAKQETLKDLEEVFIYISDSDRKNLREILIRGLRKALQFRISTKG